MSRIAPANPFPRRYRKILLLFQRGIDLLFPPRCTACGVMGECICARCFADICWIQPPLCEICGIPVAGRTTHTCLDPHILCHVRAAALFSGPMRKAVHALKYKRDIYLAEYLVSKALPYWPIQTWHIDVVAPIPMGKKRLQQRGYNQAQLIARYVSELTDLPLDAALVVRQRDTKSQVGLSLSDRRENLRDAFFSKPAQGKRVLLVDDVCTSGSTLQSCALAIKQAGADHVFGIALARAVPSYSAGRLPFAISSSGGIR